MTAGDDFRQQMALMWIEVYKGLPEGVCALDGRDYATSEEAEAAFRGAIAEITNRLPCGFCRIQGRDPVELASWPTWREFRKRLDVHGPVYPWPRPQVPFAEEVPVRSYWQRRAQYVVAVDETAKPPVDPILGRPADGYGLNRLTGEFEPDTRRAPEVAFGCEDDETWPMDEDEFMLRVEAERAESLGRFLYQRLDKPEIFELYDSVDDVRCAPEVWRRTWVLWQQALRRRAFFLDRGGKPVRVTLVNHGHPLMAYRVDPATARVEPTSKVDARGVINPWRNRRVTETAYIRAVENQRRTLQDIPPRIAELYAQVDRAEDEWAIDDALVRAFDLWTRHFAKRDQAAGSP